MVNRPEIYAQLMAGNMEVVKELIDKGLLDPAGVLNQTSGSPGYNPNQIINNLLSGGMGGMMGGFQNPQSNSGMPGQQNTGSQGQLQAPTPQQNIHDRIREEIKLLEKLPGAKTEAKPGTDDYGIPDNSYDLRVRVARGSGGEIIVYFTCPAGYPKTPPILAVEINDEEVPFQSAVLRRWIGQYLVEIVHEIRQFYV
jgi:hypothetical protein